MKQVRVVGLERIDTFARKHPDSRPSLDRWVEVVKKAEWKTTADVRNTFRTASFVDDMTVFDIGGGKYRLIALITFVVRTALIKEILTHKEYDKGSWKKK